MWLRLLPLLRCPLCGDDLELSALRQGPVDVSEEDIALARARGLFVKKFAQYIDEGVLLCSRCAVMFPIVSGLPVLLPYTTPLHWYFKEQCFSGHAKPYPGYRFPSREPVSGERLVMKSFSKEWLDYDYDGVIWEMSYEEHEKRFLQEIGPALTEGNATTFLEIGCGLGITTYLAHKNAHVDAVGLDLSLAVSRASQHYRSNPFLHFVQASVFAIPLRKGIFDVTYSRGVLHHTYSTHEAFRAVVPHCRRSGVFYLWVYGLGSIKETPFRRAAYLLESVMRPLLSRNPTSWPAKLFLGAMAWGYMAFNRARRFFIPSIQPLTFSRGLHAARDRFTPEYAHRHDSSEVVGWFREMGFAEIQVPDWKTMPSADRDDFRRNVGVRGKLKLGSE